MELEVYSQLEIPAGEELTISYLPSILLTLPHRQEKLAATWFFNCHCNRSELPSIYTGNIGSPWWLPLYQDQLQLNSLSV